VPSLSEFHKQCTHLTADKMLSAIQSISFMQWPLPPEQMPPSTWQATHNRNRH